MLTEKNILAPGWPVPLTRGIMCDGRWLAPQWTVDTVLSTKSRKRIHFDNSGKPPDQQTLSIDQTLIPRNAGCENPDEYAQFTLYRALATYQDDDDENLNFEAGDFVS